MGRRYRKAGTCVDCKKVPDGEFCTDRYVPKNKIDKFLEERLKKENLDLQSDIYSLMVKK